MNFDLIVLGGGSGGIASAVRAAKHGANVAVVEHQYLGGTCVNLGCVPKKIMYNAATLADYGNKLPDFGFKPVALTLDWQILVNKREAYIEKLRETYAKRFSQHHITRLTGTGTFVNAKTIAVNGQTHQAEHIIIATGSEPLIPTDIAGIEHAISSDGFFALRQQPHKAVIIGSGYIAVELAGVLHSLGTETHLLIRGKRPLSRFDHLLGDTLMEIMQQQGMHVHLEHRLASIRLQKNGAKTLVCQNGTVINEVDIIIVAVGRTPHSLNLNLSAVNVETDERDFIRVDALQNTNIPGIYALGDVTNAPALTPVAIAAGRKLSDRIFGAQPEACLDYQHICSVVFSHPPLGTVGLSEQEAISQFGREQVKIYQTRFNPMFDALSDLKIPTAMKLITVGQEERIIGLHLIGYNADEILQGFGVAIKMRACKRDFDNTVAIHPTIAEELVTME